MLAPFGTMVLSAPLMRVLIVRWAARETAMRWSMRDQTGRSSWDQPV